MMDIKVIMLKIMIIKSQKVVTIMGKQHILHMSKDMHIKTQQEEITMETLHIIIDIM